MSKKRLLVASFGTTYRQTRALTLDAIENDIRNNFPSDYDFARAYTSPTVCRIIKERKEEKIDYIDQALERAAADKIDRLVVIPTHMMDGIEFQKLADKLMNYKDRIGEILLGEPLLTSDEDFLDVMEAVEKDTRAYDDGQTAICLMGHGTEDRADKVYSQMQELMRTHGLDNYYIATVEGQHTLTDILEEIRKSDYEKILLQPLLVVAGEHAMNDMAGDKEDSWKSLLEAEGYQVECRIRGLGEIPGIREIYVRHGRDIIGG